MAGIYIHIPFCKKACFYCDFHFDVSFKYKKDIIESLQNELILRKSFFNEIEQVSTIYFGGGTPSVLDEHELAEIFKAIYNNYNVSDSAEITFECNPDDLTPDYLAKLKSSGINRLSIGVQSFNDEHLQWMNRSHNNSQSLSCIHEAAKIGFKDITIDLIYGVPGLSLDEWEKTVQTALNFPINHLSAYSLTLEQNTPYQKLVKQKKYLKPSEESSSEHYNSLVRIINEQEWEHYEVSNFCKKDNYSKHNTAYWQNKKYLGIGPSAHSFNGKERLWNVSNNKEYLNKISNSEMAYEMEELSNADRLNECILTGLRTKWGIDLSDLKTQFQYDIETIFSESLIEWQTSGWIIKSNSQLQLTSAGMLFADYISSELFLLDE